MYKGKYEQNQTPATPTAAEVPAPQKKAEASTPQHAPQRRPVSQHAPQSRPNPQRASQHASQGRPAPQRRPDGQRRPDTHRRPDAQRRRKQGFTKGTYVFYGIYLALILIFFIGIAIAMGALKDWLVNYQAAQPEEASQQIFTELFSDPDWSNIYQLANPDNQNERATAAFVEHMNEQIGGDELSFVQTSGGTDVMKYFVLHGRQVVAAFSMRPANKDADVTQWQFDSVEVYFTWSCNLSYSIVTLPGCTVTVNGEALDDSDIVRSVTTKAEEYLPNGVQGFRLLEYQVTGLEEKPAVSVTGKDGNPVEITFDEATKTYTQVMPEAPTIPQAEYDVVLAATKAYTKYVIAGGTTELRKYFDSSSEIYKTITGGMIIRQSFTKYVHGQEVITDYYRYSDTLFSAKIKLITTVSSAQYGDKDVEVDSTFIFDKSSGKWVVHDMLNVNIQEQVEEVRLTYKDADGNVLSSEMVNADTKVLATPTVTVPEGKTFAGWQEEIIDEQGNIGLVETLYTPDANGNVSLASRKEPLEPMVLVPKFEDAKEAG